MSYCLVDQVVLEKKSRLDYGLMRSIWKEKSNSTFDHELSTVKLGFCLAVLHAWQLDANPSTSSNLLDFKCVGCTPFVHFNEVIVIY